MLEGCWKGVGEGIDEVEWGGNGFWMGVDFFVGEFLVMGGC